MKNRYLALLVLPVLFFVALPAHAESPFTISVKSITMVKIPPTCEVRATKKRMTSGGSMEIVWKSDRATSMTGLVKGDTVWPTKGRQRVSIAVLGKHEFPMTFEGPGGKTTCVAKVFVHPKRD